MRVVFAQFVYACGNLIRGFTTSVSDIFNGNAIGPVFSEGLYVHVLRSYQEIVGTH